MDNASYTITSARYAKGMLAVRCVSSGTGLRTRAARIAGAVCRNRYSGREHAYIMTPAQAKLFRAAFDAGWDGSYLFCDVLTDLKEVRHTKHEARKILCPKPTYKNPP